MMKEEQETRQKEGNKARDKEILPLHSLTRVVSFLFMATEKMVLQVPEDKVLDDDVDSQARNRFHLFSSPVSIGGEKGHRTQEQW